VADVLSLKFIDPLILARERAEKGLVWLLEIGPIYGFDLGRVDIERLDMANGCFRDQKCCVFAQAGQRDMNLLTLLSEITGDVLNWRPSSDIVWSQTHGFMSDSHVGVTYSLLDKVWRQIITDHRSMVVTA
jgi:hypothetical protein